MICDKLTNYENYKGINERVYRALEHAAHRKRENSRDDADENEHENRQIIKPHELIYSEHRAEHRLVD